MTEFHFDLHGLVRGRVRGPEWLIGPARRELGFFASAEPPELDLDIQVIPGSLKLVGHPFSWDGHHLGAQWRVRVKSESPIGLEVEANHLCRFIIFKWIIEPAIRVAAQKNGAIMAHAAAISDGRNGLLVAGPGGAGKTTWVLSWLNREKPYLSDDFSLYYKEKLKAYPTLMRLSGNNLLVNHPINGLSGGNKAEIWLRTIIRRLTLGRLKIYFKSAPQQSIKNLIISDDVSLAGAIWLADQKTEAGKLPRRITPEEMADRMAAVDESEAHGFGAGWLPSDFWPEHRRMLTEALTGKPCLIVAGRSLPPDAGSLEQLMTRL